MKPMDLEELNVPIPGYPNYVVTSLGEIINVNTGHVLKLRADKNGYLKVNLSVLNVKKTFYVHRLVAQGFFLDFAKNREVKHINGNLQDNTVFNLRIGSFCRSEE